MKRNNRGFTLIEVVVVVALTAILMVTVFQALAKVKENEARSQRVKDNEKTAYLTFHRLSDLFKNISSRQFFNGREISPFFRGSGKHAVFLSRAPLVSPYGGIHMVELMFKSHTLFYREISVPGLRQGESIGFGLLKEVDFMPLFEEVQNLSMQYFSWDGGRRSYLWKKNIDTFKNDVIPQEIQLNMVYKGKLYEFNFPKLILDEDQEVPGDLFQ
jgi:prepilin-type N-terminal cleavage/methylation domain-containing protein